jgi:two-component system chemotaxis sensor kinase CheA
VLALAQVQDLFVQEAVVRLAHLSHLLLELERTGGSQELVDAVFRELHTLKGSAAVADLDAVSRCAHELEELVEPVRAGQRPVTPELIDTLLAGADRLAAEISATHPVPEILVDNLETVTPDTVTSGATEPNGHSSGGAAHAGAVLVSMDRIDELVRLVGEAATAHLRVGGLLNDRFGVDPASCAEFNDLSRAINELQDRAMRTQMVPVATITDNLQRAVRDLARAQGKDVRWETRGAETELDQGVLTRLSESLLHLVRNAVDHGMESPAERVAAGKTPHGTIRLHAMQLGSEVIIAITDDGRGVNIENVRRQAERQGVDTDGMAEEELLQLTFRPALSTTSFVTDVSGRGVGLDVVRANVEAARGRVEVRSQTGGGSEFRIVVPITLAVLRCLLVEAGGQRFALPFHRVVVSLPPASAARAHAEGRPVVLLDGRAVQSSALAETLGLPTGMHPSGPIVVLADTAHQHAFQVDRLVGQRDVVVKGLSELLPHLPVLAGASVEPDGSVLLVLDPPGLIQRARHSSRPTPPSAADEDGMTRRRILVVDDALVVRELQRNILERAGYQVRVAIDGSQALSRLAEEPSDLVLTDIEMPVMDGFELTASIRAHPTLANIPVLILSSRADDTDRQRGLDAGADGYIVKSGFDEGSLLTAVSRLIGGRS